MFKLPTIFVIFVILPNFIDCQDCKKTIYACPTIPISQNGSCGVNFSTSCENSCCSEGGFCSDNVLDCQVSTGCQVGFGNCWVDFDLTVTCTSFATIYTTSTTTTTTSTTTTTTSKTTSTVSQTPLQSLFYGAHVDWGTQTPSQYSQIFQLNPSVWGSFLNIASDFQSSNMQSHIDQILSFSSGLNKKRQLVYNVAAMPWGGIKGVTDNALIQLVKSCKDAENRGVHVIVRFAHEMNGLWYPWGQDRQEYRDGFRRVAMALKQGSPKSEMMWAPNWFDCTGRGQDYDPYGDWYPGDDVVDWVALSFYFFSHQWPYVNDEAKGNHFINGISGNMGTCGKKADFYNVYARLKGKKFALAETGAPWIEGYVGINGATSLSRMQSWWKQLYNSTTMSMFPLFKLIVWFEYRKYEDGQMREFRIGNGGREGVFRQDLGKVDGKVMYYDRP